MHVDLLLVVNMEVLFNMKCEWL